MVQIEVASKVVLGSHGFREFALDIHAILLLSHSVEVCSECTICKVVILVCVRCNEQIYAESIQLASEVE